LLSVKTDIPLIYRSWAYAIISKAKSDMAKKRNRLAGLGRIQARLWKAAKHMVASNVINTSSFKTTLSLYY
jgi:hypothetical protein